MMEKQTSSLCDVVLALKVSVLRPFLTSLMLDTRTIVCGEIMGVVSKRVWGGAYYGTSKD